MAGTDTGRQRYRWLVLLVAAAILVVWFFTPTPDDPASSGSGTTTADSPSAVPPATSTDDETGFPPTDGGVDPVSGLPYVDEASLPAEARDVLELIDAGGPFPEDRDGITFENREDLLPQQPMGYYREYTVPTPGLDGRGARRIVTGDGGEYYWTDDHYDSFSRIERST